jgi:hypothetical protein
VAVAAEQGVGAPDVATSPRRAGWEVLALAAVAGIATIVLGIVPSPLFDLARDVAGVFSQFV